MKRLAIMQPYFFPYIGYWQLVDAVDRFVIYDDVNYIKGGWINRNRILINGRSAFVTAPLHQSSPYRKICDTDLLRSPIWRDKLVKMVELTYRSAPHFPDVFPVVSHLLRHEAENLSDYLAYQLQSLASFMKIRTEFVMTSRTYQNAGLSGQARVLDICAKEGASSYANLAGGRHLYDHETFFGAGLDLVFISTHTLPYRQRAAGFVPNLSIIDMLMEVGVMGVRQRLDAYDRIGRVPGQDVVQNAQSAAGA